MKRLLMTAIIALIFFNLSYAQIPKEAFELTNSLPGLWNNGLTEEAVESSLELFRLSPSLFIDRIHNTLALQLAEDSERRGHKYLDQLYQKGNSEINKIILPIFLWSKVILTIDENDSDDILEELNFILKGGTNYESRTERYCLLVLLELDKKNAINIESKEMILQKIISNLESFPSIVELEGVKQNAITRGWSRYLLAYSYYYLHTFRTNHEVYLKNASDYSPDLIDRQYRQGYFYDALLLTGNAKEIGFKHSFRDYLYDNNRDAEALTLMCEISFGNPSDENMDALRRLFEKINGTEPFSDYWTSFINKMGKPIPHVSLKSETEELDLSKKSNKWIFIDIWGTWCGPCIEELPDLQLYYTENLKNNNSNLEIFTFSFGSQNLKDFMSDNKYSFPVIEIDKHTNDLFDVSGYPTKMLVTPYGNYITIPFGFDWKMFIRNYTSGVN